MILNRSIIDSIKNYFSNYTNRATTYTDWNDKSSGITESELDLSELITSLNRTFCASPYSQYIFKQGNRELCPFEVGDWILIPLKEEHEDMR